MRLLKTGPYVPGNERLEVVQKWGRDIPTYAILSHTWSQDPDEEVLLSDIEKDSCVDKPAFSKLVNAMRRAKLDGYGWLWIDTCCIDKTSSVELSEAINSMYSYYKNSKKCYAYLADVSDPYTSGSMNQFRESRWWRRGWTLQELLAPSELQFFSQDWNSLGYKADQQEIITEITGIESQYLTGNVEHASIAKRMSWAASRETTREEDIAYSLIGIFEVNMPMLYGEGPIRAFIRLQEEIMKSSEDQSIYVWVKSNAEESSVQRHHGLLADSPKDFEHTGNTISYTELREYKPSTMTARGLNMTLPLAIKNDKVAVAALQCPVSNRGNNDWLAVYLERLPTGFSQYARVDCHKLACVSELGKSTEVYIRQQFPSSTIQTIFPNHFFQIRRLICDRDNDPRLADYSIEQSSDVMQISSAVKPPVAQSERWSKVGLVYRIRKTPGALAVALLIKRKCDGESFILMLGATTEFEVVFYAQQVNELGAVTSMQDAFKPKPPGEYIDLDYHRVRVIVEEVIRIDQKIYFVDIQITALPTLLTPAELFQDALDTLAAPAKIVANATIGNKFRHLLSRTGHNPRQSDASFN